MISYNTTLKLQKVNLPSTTPERDGRDRTLESHIKAKMSGDEKILSEDVDDFMIDLPTNADGVDIGII